MEAQSRASVASQQTIEQRAPSAQGGEHRRVQTLDDKFAEVARRVPEFGGMFIGPEKNLNVYLLNTDPETLKAVEQAILEVFGARRIPKGGVRAMKGQFGFSRLKEWHDQARVLLSIPGVIMSDIDESRNRLTIGLERVELQSRVETELLKLHIPLEAVMFAKMKPPEPLEQELIGGRRIDRPVSNNYVKPCTLGFIAVLNGIPGFVTAAHCTNDGIMGGAPGTSFRSPDWLDSVGAEKIVGTETINPPPFSNYCPGQLCRYSDSAFVRILPGITWEGGAIDSPGGFYSIVEGNWASNFEVLDGEDVWKMGQATGLTGGEVKATCADVDEGNVTLLCQSFVGGTSQKGDSGSPVFSILDNNNVKLDGLLWGGFSVIRTGLPFPWQPITPEVEEGFIFSPLNSIGGDLGLFDYTWGNFPPTVQITKPSDGAKVGYGGLNITTFEASVSDFQGGTAVLKWFSSEANPPLYMGTGSPIEFTFSSKGSRVVTAQATDQSGNTSSAHITVVAVPSTPQVSIIKPTPGQILYKGYTYAAQGSSLDYQTLNSLPCNSLQWTSSVPGGGFPKSGCTPQLTFQTNGWRLLYLKGTDPEGLTRTASVAVNVIDGPLNSPPVATILSPPDYTLLDPSQVTTLIGTANGKSPISYEWSLNSGTTHTVLSSGSINNGQQTSLAWKPSDSHVNPCGSAIIFLSAEGANSLTATAAVTVSFFTSECVR